MTSRRVRRFQPWRRAAGAAQALLYLGLPFVTVGGESALRLDVPGGRLHAFGASFAIDEAFVVLAATLLATAALLLVTLLYGRAWCGWSCPQTVLGDLTSWVSAAHPERSGRAAAAKSRGRWRRPLGFAAVAGVSVAFGFATLGYFVPPRELLARLASGSLGPVLAGGWLAVAGLLFADLAFLRTTFCETVCPYAKLQGVLFDRSTLVVAYDARRAADCVDCGACVRVCPTHIDIRHGLQMECIACAKCVDACQPIMAKLRRAPDLVGYAWGEPGGRPRPLRPGVLGVGAATLACAGLLAFTVAERPAVEVVAVPAAAFAPRRTADGHVVNAWSVALENHRRAAVEVSLGLEAPGAPAGAELSVRPDRVALGPGERRDVHAVLTARGLPPGRAAAALVAEVREGGRAVERRSTPITLAVPESP